MVGSLLATESSTEVGAHSQMSQRQAVREAVIGGVCQSFQGGRFGLGWRFGRWPLAAAVCCSLAGFAPAGDERAESVFSRQIQPLLSRHCYQCHGPDEATREGGLRLDDRASALIGGDSSEPAIVPGEPDTSLLMERITSQDEWDRMPPPEIGPGLQADEVELIRQWIAGGADYEQHWAWTAPKRPTPPTADPHWLIGSFASAGDVDRSSGSLDRPGRLVEQLAGQEAIGWNPIDAFLYPELAKRQLGMQSVSDPAGLLRRLCLDLTGLPPTPEQLQRFTANPSYAEYERQVDALLASPAYGQRWARAWLDLARYADTNGYEKDRPRTIWPYRDWVIGALNADLPFDQFTLEQLAGDLLPDASMAQRVATGFHRNTMTNEEGGIDPLEYRYHALVDRVGTTGTVWLGLSVACAQCHTHKYDPISHREYFELMALIDNVSEPELSLVDAAFEQQLSAWHQQGEQLWEETQRAVQEQAESLDRWRDELKATNLRWELFEPAAWEAGLSRLVRQSDGSWLAEGDQSKRDIYRLEGSVAELPSLILLEALPDQRLPRFGPGRIDYEGPLGDFFLSELSVRWRDRSLPLSGAAQSFASGSSTAAMAIDGNPLTGWSINGGQGQTHRAVFAIDHHRAGDHADAGAVADGAEDAAEGASESSLAIELLFERYYAAPLGRFRIWLGYGELPTAWESPPVADGANEGAEDKPHSAAAVGGLEQLVHLPPQLLAASSSDGLGVSQQRSRLTTQATADPQDPQPAAMATSLEGALVGWLPQLEPLRKRWQEYLQRRPQPLRTLVMEDRGEDFRRVTVMRHRGEYLQPTDVVEPRTPAFLPPMADSLPRNRLGFARWLFSSEHPLTARVLANRHWGYFFGRGLVETIEDVGLQGSQPSHPELLDFLARYLADPPPGSRPEDSLAWSLKRLHRLLVTSHAYRQAPRSDAVRGELDPTNMWLSRAPRQRLEAEQLRDAALAVAGLLDQRIGGPSVFPPQPEAITTEGAYGAFKWQVSSGGDRYRRSLYTFAKRTAPFAMLQTFDAPSGEACLARRLPSNTPLQALTLLNDQILLEAAIGLGQQLPSEANASVIDGLFVRVLGRAADSLERQSAETFWQQQYQQWLDDPSACRRFLTLDGRAGHVAPAAAAEVEQWSAEQREQSAAAAAWTGLIRVLINTDEFVTRG
jgi:mono/diheme cytochrome c family protein